MSRLSLSQMMMRKQEGETGRDDKVMTRESILL